LSILDGINGIIPELSDHSLVLGGFPQVYTYEIQIYYFPCSWKRLDYSWRAKPRTL
jgi:hypothetical protein